MVNGIWHVFFPFHSAHVIDLKFAARAEMRPRCLCEQPLDGSPWRPCLGHAVKLVIPMQVSSGVRKKLALFRLMAVVWPSPFAEKSVRLSLALPVCFVALKRAEVRAEIANLPPSTSWLASWLIGAFYRSCLCVSSDSSSGDQSRVVFVNYHCYFG